MELFITGGTGFIGQAVARKAISLGHQVTALVREDKVGGRERAGTSRRETAWRRLA